MLVAGDESPRKVYHHCRRLRRARDRCLEEPTCLVCLLVVLLVCLFFFAFEAWWISTRRWPGASERAVMEAPKMVQQRFERIGCYPLDGEDTGANSQSDIYNYDCMTAAPAGTRCRSGLPFYVFTFAGDHVVSWRMCAEFCLLKGFDVSGVVDASECRCGASERNRDVWRDGWRGKKRPDLQWQPGEASVDGGDPRCRIVASFYVGQLPVPRRETDLSEKDLAYVESVILGKRIDQITDWRGESLEEPPKLNLQSLSQLGPSNYQSSSSVGLKGELMQAYVLDNAGDDDDNGTQLLSASLAQDRSSLRSCYPHQCAAGVPWPIRTTYAATGIPYAFDEDMPESARKAFRSAITAYHAATCILFNEVSTSYADEYKILIKDDEDGCFTSPVGFPLLYKQDTEINLGWCNTERQIGNMIHELGHALGMAHEHMRPDRDNYVKVDYEGMSPLMHAQYAKDANSYIGSETGGPAPYDYGSLMHYPATSQMRTLPIINGRGVHDAEVGQRRAFSVEDVKQLRDMYQCDNREDLCDDMDEELGAAISIKGRPATCQDVRTYCKNKKFGKEITFFCPKTCKVCDKTPAIAKRSSDVQGCRDSNPFCSRYKHYCPLGLVVGEEQWMAENCRRTCMIPKHCGGHGLDIPTPVEDRGIELPRTKTCMDSGNTNLLNVLGQVEGCAGLKDRCHDLTLGAQVRSACPATCGQCREGPLKATLGAEPQLMNLTLAVAFVLEGDFFDLGDAEQERELRDSIRPTLRDLYRPDADISVNHAPECGEPCQSGHVRISVQCCTPMGPGCDIECEDLRNTFQRYDAAGLTRKLAGRGHAGIQVQKVAVSSSMDHTLTVVFNSEWAIRGMTVLGVSSLICLLFAVTRAQCFLHPDKRRVRGVRLDEGDVPLHTDTEADPELG